MLNDITISMDFFIINSNFKDIKVNLNASFLSRNKEINNYEILDSFKCKNEYALAASSGVLTTIIDLMFLRRVKFDLNTNVEEIFEVIKEFVVDYTKKNNLINNLEGIGVLGFLVDFSKYPSIFGLICSILLQFTQNIKSKIEMVYSDLTINRSFFTLIVVSGFFSWLLNIIDNNVVDEIDDSIPSPLKVLVCDISRKKEAVNSLKAFVDGNEDFNKILINIYGETYIKETKEEIGRNALLTIINEALTFSSCFVSNLLKYNQMVMDKMLAISTAVYFALSNSDGLVLEVLGVDDNFNTVMFELDITGVEVVKILIREEFYDNYNLSKQSDEARFLQSFRLYLTNTKIFHKNEEFWKMSLDEKESLIELVNVLYKLK